MSVCVWCDYMRACVCVSLCVHVCMRCIFDTHDIYLRRRLLAWRENILRGDCSKLVLLVSPTCSDIKPFAETLAAIRHAGWFQQNARGIPE